MRRAEKLDKVFFSFMEDAFYIEPKWLFILVKP
jgi:hypothetical protein